MDTFCGLGLPEIVIVVLIAYVFIGPERSRELAITSGRWLRRIITSAWWREFNDVTSALRDLPNTLIRMSELEDSLRQIQTDITQATQIDLNLNIPVTPQPPSPETITTPAAIRSAVTDTIPSPEKPLDPPTSPEAGEPHDS